MVKEPSAPVPHSSRARTGLDAPRRAPSAAAPTTSTSSSAGPGASTSPTPARPSPPTAPPSATSAAGRTTARLPTRAAPTAPPWATLRGVVALPMPVADAVFLLAERREQPMHVASLSLFDPPDGGFDPQERYRRLLARDDVAPRFALRPRRGLSTGGAWGWENDPDVDIEHHVRRSALPEPGRVRELLELVGRLHATPLDRRRPLWETHQVEGLRDGRIGQYTKTHHALMDGVTGMTLLRRMLSPEPDADGSVAWWTREAQARDDAATSRREQATTSDRGPGADAGDGAGDVEEGGPDGALRLAGELLSGPARALRAAAVTAREAAAVGPLAGRALLTGLREPEVVLPFSAPPSILNTSVSASRRVAAQGWPMERVRGVAKRLDVTLNDVVLTMCAGALRSYLRERNALPSASLVAMVPVSVKTASTTAGNAVGALLARLGTERSDVADRLAAVTGSMRHGKELYDGLSPAQVLALSAAVVAPLAANPVLRRPPPGPPPFNLVISNVPGLRRPSYAGAAHCSGVYPLSIVLDGQALNITVSGTEQDLCFGLVGCRRSVPSLQRLLGHLDDELGRLEQLAG